MRISKISINFTIKSANLLVKEKLVGLVEPGIQDLSDLETDFNLRIIACKHVCIAFYPLGMKTQVLLQIEITISVLENLLLRTTC